MDSKRDIVEEVRQAKREKRMAARRKSRRQRKCFFTWPFGHHYDRSTTGNCSYCGKKPRSFHV